MRRITKPQWEVLKDNAYVSNPTAKAGGFVPGTVSDVLDTSETYGWLTFSPAPIL